MPHPVDSTSGHARLHARITERLAQGALELPLFPETAARVLVTCDSPDCDAEHLAALLAGDPALASNVLRVANSAAYAPAEPILSLPQAVSRLGFGAVCNIATALALKSEIFVAPGHEGRLTQIWIHSTLTAAWCKEIARQRRRNVEGAFLCGLLHDVGQPVLLQLLSCVSQDAGPTLSEEELESLLHEGHDVLGQRLLNEWRLPPWTAQAARHHHDPAAATHCLEEVHTTSLADALAHWTLALHDAELERRVREHSSLGRLGLYPDDLNVLLERRELVLQSAEAFQ